MYSASSLSHDLLDCLKPLILHFRVLRALHLLQFMASVFLWHKRILHWNTRQIYVWFIVCFSTSKTSVWIKELKCCAVPPQLRLDHALVVEDGISLQQEAELPQGLAWPSPGAAPAARMQEGISSLEMSLKLSQHLETCRDLAQAQLLDCLWISLGLRQCPLLAYLGKQKWHAGETWVGFCALQKRILT